MGYWIRCPNFAWAQIMRIVYPQEACSLQHQNRLTGKAGWALHAFFSSELMTVVENVHLNHCVTAQNHVRTSIFCLATLRLRTDVHIQLTLSEQHGPVERDQCTWSLLTFRSAPSASVAWVLQYKKKVAHRPLQDLLGECQLLKALCNAVFNSLRSGKQNSCWPERNLL